MIPGLLESSLWRPIVPVALAVLGAASLGCSGGSPTEVVASPPASSAPAEVLAVDPHPPGEDPGCPQPCHQEVTGEIVCGDLLDLVTEVAGTLVPFTPPEGACVTKILNNRRVMSVELDLGLVDPGLVTGEHQRFDFGDYPDWLCPVPGQLNLDLDALLFTDDWNFRVTPAGHLTGKCTVHL